MRTIQRLSLWLAFFLSAAFAHGSNATTITISGSDLSAGSNGDGLTATATSSAFLKSQLVKLLLDELKKQDQLDGTQVVVSAGGLVFIQNEPDDPSSSSCNGVKLTKKRYEIFANSNLSFTLTFNPLKLTDPITVSTEIPVHGTYYAHAKIWMGFNPLGLGCVSSDVADGDIRATIGSATLRASMTLNLAPSKGLNNTLLFVDSSVDSFASLRNEKKVDIDTSNLSVFNSSDLGAIVNMVAGVFDDILPVGQFIYDNFGNSKAASNINNRLFDNAVKIQNRVRATSFAFPTNAQILGNIIGAQFQLPYLAEYIASHAVDIAIALLNGDPNGIIAVLASSAACEATRLRYVDLPHQTLYTNVSGSCTVADLDGVDAGRYFTDAGCSQSVAYRPTYYSEFCSEILKSPNTVLGNPKAWATPDFGTKWTLARAPRLELGVDSVKKNKAPFMKRAVYRTINQSYFVEDYQYPFRFKNIFETEYQQQPSRYRVISPGDAYTPYYVEDLQDPRRFYEIPAKAYQSQPTRYQIIRVVATCDLEMRIYKTNVDASNLKPLLALHGGSWRYRGFGFVGLEAQLSHLTEQGYVVFMPSYRLAGQSDGNSECQNALWSDITADAEAALQWVRASGSSYGASNDKVALFGQSAGAHLAGWLVTRKPNDVSKAMLLYPPTDFRDFVLNSASLSPTGIDSLEGFLGVKLSNPGILSNAGVLANSFPGLIAANPAAYPPVFLIHGRSDTLVPSQQSVRMCNAYTGSSDPTNIGPAKNDGGSMRAIYNCGTSQLHMIAQGQHVLDFCLPGVACPAGDAASQSAARDSLRLGREWLSGRRPWLVPILNLLIN